MTAGEERPLELWGGFECSVVRVGEDYRNQFEETGHHGARGDLAQAASLGLRRLRYPVLWETVSPDSPGTCDWRFPDARLAEMQALGLQPIAGLLHHGSGPRYTSMTDPGFPALLAQHAGRVAARYPWIDMYTPVNEPLTTARFSGLYGHWYPHGRNMATFLRCLVNECLASLLAMREIRKVCPAAQLVQTEDLGKVFSTPRLRAQAEHENERRWLSLDLLCGRVDRHHPWHAEMLRNGITAAELDLLATGEGRPDIIGINYYATSERFLDEALQRYPVCFHGGNGRQRYADVEALRVDLAEGDTGVRPRLAEAWERYGLPLAVTEVHHGSTREEQLRWLAEVWDDARGLAAEGVDVRAVTAWSLLGALDWNSLLTERRGFYEVGAFDIRGPRLRMTAIGKALREIAATGKASHPVLDQRGWWRREGRHYHPPSSPVAALPQRPRPILILGEGSALGREFAAACRHRGLEAVPLARAEAGDRRAIDAALLRHRPWAVIDTAPLGGVSPGGPLPLGARADQAACEALLAGACAARHIPLVAFSSSRVFDGAMERPYVEADAPSPAGLSGHAIVAAEERVAEAHGGALVIRTSELFGPDDEPDDRLLSAWAGLVHDRVFFTATYIPDLVRVALDLLVDGERGIWHLANHGALSLAEMGLMLPVDEQKLRVRGPLVALGSERALLMPSVTDALVRLLERVAARDAGRAYTLAAE